MRRTLRLALGQINCTVGDLPGNARKILKVIGQAQKMGADLVAFPELALTGYPPEDLLLNSSFIRDNLKALKSLVRSTRGITAIVGFVDMNDDIYNAAALLHDGELAGIYHKFYLPNYGVFDENRYFQSGKEFLVFELKGIKIGMNICEDIWYPGDPTRTQCLQGDAQLIVNISSSPYHAGKRDFRQRMLSTRAWDYSTIVAYVNLVGGQDELVFDGGSMVIDQAGELVSSARSFVEDVLMVDLDLDKVFLYRLHDPRRRKEKLGPAAENRLRCLTLRPVKKSKKVPFPQRNCEPPGRLEEIYRALVLGTGDYVRKNGFRKVVLGLSGGIDSSLTAVIAADALGNRNVVGISMPSMYSSRESLEDARALAGNLGIEFRVIPIKEVFTAYLKSLEDPFGGRKPDVTEENLQARIRGNLLMALSNKFGWLVLTTGNKSETGVGYCTLYGDTAGGFAVIKDVPKTLVYELAVYRNKLGSKPVIPLRVMEKPPSAELRPNQKDTDSLPPYEVLDPILQAYVEEDQSPQMILARGFAKSIVEEVIRRVDLSEYKRRQAPPGIKITPRAFGKDRRLPITNRYRMGRAKNQ
ncbi:MAG: NAD+ synthase [Deltaproteobacteria bacterium]|nr:NAD+ synthase [Deltaproteobacteria bacterium]